MVLVPEWIVWLLSIMLHLALLLFLLEPLILLLIHLIHLLTFHVHLMSLLDHLLSDMLLLGKLTSEHILSSLLLPLRVLACLSLLQCLQAHPLLVTVCLALFSHLFFSLFTSVDLTHVSDPFSLIDFLLHQPVVHSLASLLILFPLLLGDMQQFFFDFILCLVNKLAFESFLSIFSLQPVRVAEPTAAISTKASLNIASCSSAI